MNYQVTMVQHQVWDVFIEADSLDEAIELARQGEGHWRHDVASSWSEPGLDHVGLIDEPTS